VLPNRPNLCTTGHVAGASLRRPGGIGGWTRATTDVADLSSPSLTDPAMWTPEPATSLAVPAMWTPEPATEVASRRRFSARAFALTSPRLVWVRVTGRRARLDTPSVTPRAISLDHPRNLLGRVDGVAGHQGLSDGHLARGRSSSDHLAMEQTWGTHRPFSGSKRSPPGLRSRANQRTQWTGTTCSSPRAGRGSRPHSP
jgi:hypothetical protein